MQRLSRVFADGLFLLLLAASLASAQMHPDADAGVFNVRTYGAKGDVRLIRNDGRMTGGSSLLHAPSAHFSPADAGKVIIVYHAGRPGAGWDGGAGDLVTTIERVLNSSTASLRSAAGSPATNVYGAFGSDDGPAFERAIARAIAHGASPFSFGAVPGPGSIEVLIPPATGYMVTHPLRVPANNITMSAYGAIVYYAGKDTFLALGSSQYDWSQIHIRGLFVWGTYECRHGITMTRVQRVHLQDCYLTMIPVGIVVSGLATSQIDLDNCRINRCTIGVIFGPPANGSRAIGVAVDGYTRVGIQVGDTTPSAVSAISLINVTTDGAPTTAVAGIDVGCAHGLSIVNQYCENDPDTGAGVAVRLGVLSPTGCNTQGITIQGGLYNGHSRTNPAILLGTQSNPPYVDAVTIMSNYFEGWRNAVRVEPNHTAARNWLIGPNAFVGVPEHYFDRDPQHAIFSDGKFRGGAPDSAR